MKKSWVGLVMIWRGSSVDCGERGVIKRLVLLIPVVVLFIGFVSPLAEAAGGDDMAETMKVIRARKQEAVAAALELTNEESKAFWPLYEEYQGHLQKVHEKILGLVRAHAKEDQSLSEQQAETMLTRYVDMESELLELKKTYIKRFRDILPSKKVFKYFQLESKLEAGLRHELATNIPLAK